MFSFKTNILYLSALVTASGSFGFGRFLPETKSLIDKQIIVNDASKLLKCLKYSLILLLISRRENYYIRQ